MRYNHNRKFDLKEKLLQIFPAYFYCPYCEKVWWRGGHKEGFVKAAATRHVYNCWTVLCFVRYKLLPFGWKDGKQQFITETQAKYDLPPRVLRGVRALVRQRRKAGYEP